MTELDKLIDICIRYRLAEFKIEEFQGRLGTVVLSDSCDQQLATKVYNAGEHLEMVIYAYGESDLRERSVKIADNLLLESLLEQRRLETYRPYALEA